MITGSEDGYVRGVSIGPNKVLNYLGNHSESDEIEPICKLGLSHDKRFAASISYDNWVKFHNISNFVDGRKNEESKQDEESDDEVDDDNDEDYESDMDDEDEKQKMPRKTDVKSRKREIERQKKQSFFSDM